MVKKFTSIISRQQFKPNGETIIEVLIAIGVAAFALGLSYSIANKSLQNAITARERNQAVNNMQNQISALKLRWQKSDQTTFNNLYAATSTQPSTFKHFCLNVDSADPSDTNWDPIPNNGSIDSSTSLSTTGTTAHYNPACVDQELFYIDIVAFQTAASQSSANPTIYQVNVRWPQIGNGATNQAVAYYRLGSQVASNNLPGGGGGGGGPQACVNQYRDVTLVADTSSSMDGLFPGATSGPDKMDVLKPVATSLVGDINPLPGKNQVGLVDFWIFSPDEVNQPLTGNAAAVDNAISVLTPHAHTPLTPQTNYAAGLTAGEANLDATTLPTNAKIMIFMTDGGLDYIYATPDQVRAQTALLKSQGIVIYTIGIGVDDPTYEQLLKDMAGGTAPGGISGSYANADDAATLSQLLQNIGSQLSCP